MAFWLSLILALPARAIEPCAGALARTSHGLVVETERGSKHLHSGHVLEVTFDDLRIENVVVRVSRHHVYMPILVEGVEREVAIDEDWLDRILHVRVIGRVYGRIEAAFFATWPPGP